MLEDCEHFMALHREGWGPRLPAPVQAPQSWGGPASFYIENHLLVSLRSTVDSVAQGPESTSGLGRSPCPGHRAAKPVHFGSEPGHLNVLHNEHRLQVTGPFLTPTAPGLRPHHMAPSCAMSPCQGVRVVCRQPCV